MTYDAKRATDLLRAGSRNPDAVFRPGQEEAIEHVVEGRGRLLVVQRTGWGKSFVYFIAIKLLREAGSGPALLISPLLSLMRNQLVAAAQMGVRAETINSGNLEEWEDIEAKIRRDEVDIVLIAPERLANEDFRQNVLAHVSGRVSLLVIDEAHCISDWGHEFRPQYRLIQRMVTQLPANLRLLGTTATANNRVLEDLEAVLGPDLNIMKGDLDRPSLTLQTIRLPDQAERLAWLAERLPELPGSGIIYALTIRDADRVTAWLKSRGLDVESYTSKSEARPKLEQALIDNKVKALVATTSLGMGFDKPDLGFVIHYQAPGSVVGYYQQVGRAGRAVDAAYGVLLSGTEEEEINDYFVENAFPTQEEVTSILEALEDAAQGLSVPELMSKVNVRKARIEKTLDLLSLESPAPLVKQRSKWQLTVATLSEEFWARAARLTGLRRDEQQQVQEYIALTSGHMEFLIQALNGDPGTVGRPTLPPLPIEPSTSLVQEAVAFLRRTSVPLQERKMWPDGGLPICDVRGQIKPHLRAEPGRALCMWGDAGWGRLVKRGKYTDGRFDDQLVAACAEMVREWNPEPYPEWVTCVPSKRHPRLVPDFAERLANALDLPFKPVIIKTRDCPEQKTMENSPQQARNVDGSLAIDDNEPIPQGPVLLVDDMVDSGWTMTISAWLLRSNGTGEVWPLALAKAGVGE